MVVVCGQQGLYFICCYPPTPSTALMHGKTSVNVCRMNRGQRAESCLCGIASSRGKVLDVWSGCEIIKGASESWWSNGRWEHREKEAAEVFWCIQDWTCIFLRGTLEVIHRRGWSGYRKILSHSYVHGKQKTHFWTQHKRPKKN